MLLLRGCTFDGCRVARGTPGRLALSVGPIEDTTFNGLYHARPTGHPPLVEVDFSGAELRDLVTFEGCDLSDSTPPAGTTVADLLYQIHADDPSVLSTGSPDRIVLRPPERPASSRPAAGPTRGGARGG